MDIDRLKRKGLWPFIVHKGESVICNNCDKAQDGPANFCGRYGQKLRASKPN